MITKTRAGKPVAGRSAADLSDSDFARLAQLIEGETGIQMPEHKIQMLLSRLVRRMRELGFERVDQYCRFLFDDPAGEAERVHFFDAITTNKTDFFREPKHFDYLLQQVLPQLAESRRLDDLGRVQIWCAGCSTGEEPYTIALLLARHAEEQKRLSKPFSFALLATDISTKVLAQARNGIYTAEQIAPVPEPLRQEYFRRHRDPQRNEFRMSPVLRSRISFHRLNLMVDRYPVSDNFDVVFCRNVMIYFNRPTQERVMQKLLERVRPGGYLFIGHSESANGFDLPARTVANSVLQKLG